MMVVVSISLIKLVNTKHLHQKLELSSDAILSICSDKYDNIWVGGWGTGLNRYNRKTQKLENLTNTKYGLWHINIFDIYADKEGILWISFGGVGLARFDFQKNTLKYYNEANSNLPVNWIFDIAGDTQGNILLCHAEGLSIFDPKTRKFKTFVWVENNITFYVRDSGIGIPDGTGEAIFERFMKIEEYKNTLYRGTGLGLAISKSLVELWKGNIWYESVEGKGTTFYFTHPADILQHNSSERTLANTKQVSLPNLTGKKILVAEDEPDNFYLLKTILDRTNAEIIWAKNGREAIFYADKELIDIVFMDIKMPDINGKEATITIKKAKSNLPVIAQTAYT
jgi:CheY-like chemotaxis protein